MKRTLFALGLSAVLAMPLLAWGQQMPSTPGTGGGTGMRMEQPREQHGQQDIDQEQIRQAQQHLKDAGFDPGPIDGQLGPQTQAALREFQKSQGLPQTGHLDDSTRARLMAQGTQESPARMPGGSTSGGPGTGSGMPGGSSPGGMSPGMGGTTSPGGSGTGGPGTGGSGR
jgi:peptidoglycan hydrolase-like protein with peptidoglycan-binding domain